MENRTADKQVDRRTFFNYVIGAAGGFITALMGIPLVGSLVLPTLRNRQANWIGAGAASDSPVEEPKPVTVTFVSKDGWIEQQEAKGIWVITHGHDNFTVFNGRCVHLGCAYNWNPSQKEFICPCHGGTYSITGKVLAGPPPRPLDTLNWRLENGNLVVQYEDFRLGVPKKEEA